MEDLHLADPLHQKQDILAHHHQAIVHRFLVAHESIVTPTARELGGRPSNRKLSKNWTTDSSSSAVS